jgi:hypothetical protein
VKKRRQLPRVHQGDKGEDGGESVQVEHHDHGRDPVWGAGREGGRKEGREGGREGAVSGRTRKGRR